LPGVRAREEREAEQRKESQAGNENHSEDKQSSRRNSQHDADELVVNAEECFEAIVEPNIEPLAERFAFCDCSTITETSSDGV